MTVTTTANAISYAGNGVTTAFAFPYVFFEPPDLVVRLIVDATGAEIVPPPVLNSGTVWGYTVSGVVTAGEFSSGGTVTFNTAPITGWTVSLVRAVPPTQTVTLIDNTKFPATTINTEFDKLTVLAQQAYGLDQQALHIPATEVGLITEAQPSGARRNRVLAWDNAGNLIHSDKTLTEIELGTPPASGQLHTPIEFGAVGNGDADDTVAVQAALNSGLPIHGLGLTYAVSGNVSLPANLVLSDARFIQLVPNVTNCRTLFADNVSNLRLTRLAINRNGNGSITAQTETSNAAGLWISGGSNHLVEDVEVWGNNAGNGIAILGATDWELVRPYVHDIRAGTASTPAGTITDDVVHGLFVGSTNSARWKIRDYKISNLQTEQIGQPAAWRFTRGIAVSGPALSTVGGFSITGGTMNGCGQGLDITGDQNPNGFIVSDCLHENIPGPAFKCANSVVNGTFSNCVAFRPGMIGFLVAASDDVVMPIDTSKIDFIGCRALQVGYGRPVGDVIYLGTGFYVEEGNPLNLTWPRSVRFIGCTADEGGLNLMARGFHSEIATVTSGNGETWVECIDCSVFGGAATTSRFGNINQGYEYRTMVSGSQSIPSGAFTAVVWNNVQYRRMPSVGGDGSEILIPRTGIALITASVTFEANATGGRGMVLRHNSTDLLGSQVFVPATLAGNAISIATSIAIPVDVGDSLKVNVFQGSGGPLGITPLSGITITMLDLGRGRT